MRGWITVRTHTTVADDEERMELQAEALWREKDDGWLLRYTEASEDGGSTTVRVTATTSGVVVERSGEMRAVMEFSDGETRECRYQTPFGTILLNIRTHRTETRLTKSGGTVRLWYELENAAGNCSRHEVEMAVKATAGEDCDEECLT